MKVGKEHKVMDKESWVFLLGHEWEIGYSSGGWFKWWFLQQQGQMSHRHIGNEWDKNVEARLRVQQCIESLSDRTLLPYFILPSPPSCKLRSGTTAAPLTDHTATPLATWSQTSWCAFRSPGKPSHKAFDKAGRSKVVQCRPAQRHCTETLSHPANNAGW